MKGLSAGILAVAALLLAPLLSGPVGAADVDATLIAADFDWHFGTVSGSNESTVNTGDALRLTVRNVGSEVHTFTFPHFAVDETLAVGATIFVNITTAASDAGRWQFHCTPHSSGASQGQDRVGMTGYLTVRAPPPPTPGFEVLAVIAAILTAFVAVVAVRVRRP